MHNVAVHVLFLARAATAVRLYTDVVRRILRIQTQITIRPTSYSNKLPISRSHLPLSAFLAFLSFTYKYVVHADGSIGNSDVKHFHITAVKQYHFYSSFVAYSESGSTDNFATSFFLFPLEIMVLLTVGLGYEPHSGRMVLL